MVIQIQFEYVNLTSQNSYIDIPFYETFFNRMKVQKVDIGLHSSICILFIDFQSNPWNSFLGDCSVVDQYLAEKPISLKWFFAHYINVFLRAVGQVPI